MPWMPASGTASPTPPGERRKSSRRRPTTPRQGCPAPPSPPSASRPALRPLPLHLLERRARSAPPPRLHRHLYNGVLAPNAKLRAAVTHIGRPDAETPTAQLPSPTSPSPTQQPSTDAEPTRTTSPARIRWAVLLARIYEVLPLLCPACGGPMRILSFITDPPVVVAILVHLELPHTPPPISPARGPPQGDFLLDQTPVFDPTEAEPIPEFVFDQSLPDEFDS